ncbi:NINE protein [Deinococcus puniceus]|uniref:NINE protein n=1 Tax=Deinococcus puniceus TaxID=1182568 RepID=UPI000ADB2C3A|nr:NINE protein [Deinococcus puniceus]
MTNDPNNPGPKPDAPASPSGSTSGNAPHWADTFDTKTADTKAAPSPSPSEPAKPSSVNLGKHAAEPVPSTAPGQTPSHTPYRSDDPFGQVTGGKSTPAPTAYAPAPQPAPMGQPLPPPTSSQLWNDAQSSVQSSVQGGLNQLASADASTKKLIAGLLAIFLGSLGIHKFYLGITKPGILMLALTLGGYLMFGLLWWIGIGFLFLLLPFVMSIVGLIEGILYLTKSDADFDAKYVRGKQEWL